MPRKRRAKTLKPDMGPGVRAPGTPKTCDTCVDGWFVTHVISELERISSHVQCVDRKVQRVLMTVVVGLIGMSSALLAAVIGAVIMLAGD